LAEVVRLKIAALGPEGTYSAHAAFMWDRSAELLYRDDFEAVFEAVESGEAGAGVVPVENSLEGAVSQNMDLLLRRKPKIVGEVVVPIRHCLLGRGKRTEVRVVVSHPQALAQCRQYLRRSFPGAEIRSTGSTAHAAKLAQEFPEMAAIAGANVAEKYGLEVLERDIQDNGNNATRFAIISCEPAMMTGRDKTSLAVYLDRDRPGALYAILGEFASRDINLTRIESRPSRRGLGDYYFFIDLEGHRDDPPVRAALDAVRSSATMVKVLGSYPAVSWEKR